MTYDDARSSNSSAIVIAAVVGILIAGSLVVLGAGAFFVVRTQAVARAEHERALMAEQKAHEIRARMEMERDRAAREEATAQKQAAAMQRVAPPSSQRKIVISLDEQGNISADGEPLVLDRLRAWLEDTVETHGALSVAIQVDNRCLFEHVASVMSVCRELEISDIEITSLPSTAGDETPRP